MKLRNFSAIWILGLLLATACSKENPLPTGSVSTPDALPANSAPGLEAVAKENEASKQEREQAAQLESDLKNAHSLLDEAEIEFTQNTVYESFNSSPTTEISLHTFTDSEQDSLLDRNPAQFDLERWNRDRGHSAPRKFNNVEKFPPISQWTTSDIEKFTVKLEKKVAALEKFKDAADKVLACTHCALHDDGVLGVRCNLASQKLQRFTETRDKLRGYLTKEKERRERLNSVLPQIQSDLAAAEIELEKGGYSFDTPWEVALQMELPKVGLVKPEPLQPNEAEYNGRMERLEAFLNSVKKTRKNHPIIDLEENKEIVFNLVVLQKTALVQKELETLRFHFLSHQNSELSKALSSQGLTLEHGKWKLGELPALLDFAAIQNSLTAAIKAKEALIKLSGLVEPREIQTLKDLAEAGEKDPMLNIREFAVDYNRVDIQVERARLEEELERLDIQFYSPVEGKWARDEKRYQTRLEQEIIHFTDREYRARLKGVMERYIEVLSDEAETLSHSLIERKKSFSVSLQEKVDSLKTVKAK